jgi:hypothetical protein
MIRQLILILCFGSIGTSVLAAEKLSCSASIMMLERIAALQGKIEHKLETGDTDGLRQLFSALQSRIRIAKSAGFDVSDFGNKTSAALNAERFDSEANSDEARDARTASPIFGFTELDRTQLLPTNQGLPWVKSPSRDYVAIMRPSGIEVYSPKGLSQRFDFAPYQLDSPSIDQIAVDDFGTVIVTDNLGHWTVRGLNPVASLIYDNAVDAMRSEIQTGIALTPDGKFFVSRTAAHSRSPTTFWNVATGEKMGTYSLRRGRDIWFLSGDGTQLALKDRVAGVKIIDLATGNVDRILKVPHGEGVLSLAASKDFKMIFAATHHEKIHVYEESEEPTETFSVTESVREMSYEDQSGILNTYTAGQLKVRYKR